MVTPIGAGGVDPSNMEISQKRVIQGQNYMNEIASAIQGSESDLESGNYESAAKAIQKAVDTIVGPITIGASEMIDVSQLAANISKSNSESDAVKKVSTFMVTLLNFAIKGDQVGAHFQKPFWTVSQKTKKHINSFEGTINGASPLNMKSLISGFSALIQDHS
ncbi:MAG: hypothetical protein P0S95_05175 [Rhabdochlamydiaceae bacterium]|nr:hypothetical protein [Candidatus Amphrikana amoebophyrae]